LKLYRIAIFLPNPPNASRHRPGGVGTSAGLDADLLKNPTNGAAGRR